MVTEVEGLSIEEWLEDNAPPPPVGEDELTVQRAMEHPKWSSLSEPTVRNRLDAMVKEGLLIKEQRTGANGNTYVYIPVGKK